MTGSHRTKKFLAPEALEAAAAEIAELVKEQQVSAAIIGGFAVQIYGSNRLTGDLDVAASERIRGLPRGKPLSFGGEQTRTRSGVPVDVILRDDKYAALYDEVVERAVRVKGVALRVARPEHLAAMKMEAGRGRDDMDLEFLLSSGAVEPAKARKVIERHLGPYAADEFDEFVAVSAWQASRGKSSS